MKKYCLVILAGSLIIPLSHVFSDTSAPLYSLKIEAGTTKVISYRHLTGSTKIDFRGTPLSPEAKGTATIQAAQGAIQIMTKFSELEPASRFGPEYLTYVLWAISPEGRATNLGELILDGKNSTLNVTTPLQSFGLVVTAEPYFAVTQVGNVVVMENSVRKDTKAQVEQLDAKYDLLERGQYSLNMSPADLQPVKLDKKVPFYLYQARNAVNIAKAAGAETSAPDTYKKAHDLLTQAEDGMITGKNKKAVPAIAREAVQNAEDARILTAKRNADRMVGEQLSQANEAVKDAEAMRDEASSDAEAARAMAAQSEKEKMKLREQLKTQLSQILETRDSARGLIMNMSDVLFQTGKYDLKQPVREKMAKVAGIVLSHPGLKLDVEGHTDSVGSDEYNQKLSENRAEAVVNYLIEQGLPSESIKAWGFGESRPVASNDTAEGRGQNRRVEIIVSGEQIGTSVSQKTIQ